MTVTAIIELREDLEGVNIERIANELKEGFNLDMDIEKILNLNIIEMITLNKKPTEAELLKYK